MNVIIMSTYNGETYLQDQMHSLLHQTVKDFVLLIRDDGSSDSTPEILRQYNDPRIRLELGENLGINASFYALLEQARQLGADRVFFCDQDDLWLPNKLEVLLRELEMCPAGPALVFSDFAMIDGEGDLIGPSYAAMAKLQIPRDGNFFPKLLAQPYVFGCASVLNRELLELVADPPAGIEMYDCWIALVASVLGTVRYLPDATIHHRFHTQNATGRTGMNSFIARLHRLTDQMRQQTANTALRLHQAQLLLDRYEPVLSPTRRRQLKELAAARQGGLRAIKTLRKHTVSRGGILQSCFFYLTVLFCKGDH